MIKVTDVAYARFQAPDLDRMEAFLVDFGLTRQHRDNETLYMRGTGPDHHLHVTHRADEPGFIGMAFNAAGMEDLEKLSRAEGASDVEEIDEPGGGYVVPADRSLRLSGRGRLRPENIGAPAGQ